jgi:UDP-glucose 4-epimerase
MKLVVTGGAGFVGSHFVDRFASENEIVVLDDLSNGSISNIANVRRRIKFLRADVSKESSIAKLGKVDGIFHLACHPRSFSFNKPARDADVNLRSTVNMLELARKSDAKLVFTSNSGIYGDPKYLPMDEKHPVDCKTPYDVNKYASELHMLAYQRQYGVRTVACRLATVYGPRQKVNEKLGWRPVVATFLEYLIKGKQPVVFGDGEQTRDLIYVKDVVDGLMKAFISKEADGEAFNLGTCVETSVNTLLRKIEEITGEKVEPALGPPSIGDLRRMCCSNEKAKKTFNFEIKYPLDIALKEYVEWYKGTPAKHR